MRSCALAPITTPTTAPTPALALAALPYYWPRAQVFDFYEAIAATPVDLVYLGETVCSRRQRQRRGRGGGRGGDRGQGAGSHFQAR